MKLARKRLSLKPKHIMQVRKQLDRAIAEVNEEVNSVTDRQVKGHSYSSNNVVMSASQLQCS
jgi:hypothetical protein